MDTINKNILLLIGARIRQVRKARGISQEELAFRVGLHRTYIGSCERGERNMTILNLFLICRALEVTVSEFFVPIE